MIIRKILLLGEMGVGKTSIVRRLKFNAFDTNYKSTIGQDFYFYDVEPAPCAGGFKFLIVDTDGKFDDAVFRDSHVRGAEAAIVVGDLTRRATLEAQIELVDKFSAAVPGRYIGCVLNKHDLVDEIPDDAKYIPEKLRDGTYPMIETSAKTGLNVKRTFDEAASLIAKRIS